MFLRRFVFVIALGFATAASAAVTDIAIPRTAPQDPMQSFLRVMNGTDADLSVEVVALDGAARPLARWTWRVKARDATTKMLKGELSRESFLRLATVRVIHPDGVTVQHVVGKAPPEKPGAFSVPA